MTRTLLIVLAMLGVACSRAEVLEAAKDPTANAPSACGFWIGDPSEHAWDGWRAAYELLDGTPQMQEGRALLDLYDGPVHPLHSHTGGYGLGAVAGGPSVVSEPCLPASGYVNWTQQGNIVTWWGAYPGSDHIVAEGVIYDACGPDDIASPPGLHCDPAGPAQQLVIEAILEDPSPQSFPGFGPGGGFTCPSQYNVVLAFDRENAGCQ